MLKHLTIRNYALIQSLEMAPSARLNIITGETGAGKSIMLGAVGLLLGKRADTKALFDEGEKCVVEGVFDISEYEALKAVFEEEELDYETESIIRREISPSGKSRAFVNDTPVTLDTLRRIGVFLMDVHSQHDTLQLADGSYQLGVVDAYARNKSLLQGYQQAYQAWRKAMRELDRLQAEALEIQKEADYNAFQLKELHDAKLEELDPPAMEEELEKLENAEEIKLKLAAAIQGLEGAEQFTVNSMLQGVLAEVKSLSRYGETYRQLNERLESVLIELRDINNELETEEGSIEVDEARTQLLQERLRQFFHLQQKHGLSELEELKQLQQALEEKVARSENLDEEIDHARRKVNEQEEAMRKAAARLSESRTAVFTKLSKELEGYLHELGMPDASLQLSVKPCNPGPLGADELALLFSANKGVAPQSLKNVASGGEFSRLMFCIKFVLADKTALPTIVFDEIDTGISGEIALKMVRMMQQMANSHQVISISHLPQIAAKGDAHYFVYKDNSQSRTVSRMKQLSEEERIQEIAKMIGGAQPSANAFESARELMMS